MTERFVALYNELTDTHIEVVVLLWNKPWEWPSDVAPMYDSGIPTTAYYFYADSEMLRDQVQCNFLY